MSFFTPEQIAALSASTVRIAPLVEMEFVSQTSRVWNGEYELTTGAGAGAKTWTPMFGTGQIEGLGLSAGGQAESVTLTLSGIPSDRLDILGTVLSETPDVTQRSVRIYLQLFDNDWQAQGSPIGIWWGFLQPPKVSRTPMQDGEGSVQTITVDAENAFFNRSRPPAGRYTDRDQQTRSPGDKFFQYTSSLLFKTFKYPDF